MKIELSCVAILIPKIEKILKSNVNAYEQLILIKKHIANWRNK